MGSLKEVIVLLKEGLTLTPEQKLFLLLAPGGVSCTGPLLAKIGKLKGGEKHECTGGRNKPESCPTDGGNAAEKGKDLGEK